MLSLVLQDVSFRYSQIYQIFYLRVSQEIKSLLIVYVKVKLILEAIKKFKFIFIANYDKITMRKKIFVPAYYLSFCQRVTFKDRDMP